MRRFFVSTIEALATRFDAQFLNHTLQFTWRETELRPSQSLEKQSWRIVSPIDSQFATFDLLRNLRKTLFVQFESTPSLLQLRQTLQHASGPQDAYDLSPHLSLLYKEMPTEVKLDLAASIRVPFTEVLFDLAKAVVCPRPIKSRHDVECWRVSAEQKLIA
jgi:hypothetical protein